MNSVIYLLVISSSSVSCL
ncbi:hypothetical protein MTR67_040198 [Solanum verrucosum]|uniref:Uncharacterized protein n=1 Tax=Solanum verrucosum TaxID=315347 RepID=A0AAF0UJZ7_SOLVR|nr:hypothetical protein MTR67_040198 [Solanum verrucosum]